METTATKQRVRRTQQERSAGTRAQLLDATLEVLTRRGYANTTTTEVAEQAGVSRGAQLHHFPTKAELVLNAVEHLLTKRTEQVRKAFARMPAGADRIGASLDVLWAIHSSSSFYPWLEFVVAARTDPELHRSVAAMEQRFGETIQRTFREFFPAAEVPTAAYEVVPAFTFAFMRGLALDKIAAQPGDPRIANILAMFKALVSAQSLVPELQGDKS